MPWLFKGILKPLPVGRLHLVFLILLIGQFGGPAHAQTQAQRALEAKKILILHSFESTVPVVLETDKGLLTTLAVRRDTETKPVFRVAGPEAEPRSRV